MIRVFVLLLASCALACLYESSLVKRKVLGVRRETANAKLAYYVLAILLVWFAGMRTVMNDTLNYALAYLNDVRTPAGWDQVFAVDWSVGSNPFFNVYMRILKTVFGANYHILLFISSWITVGSYLRFLRKYSPQFAWSIFGLMSFTVYAFSLAAMKQSLAIAIGIWAVPDLIQGRYVKGGIRLLVASLFHPYIVILGASVVLTKEVWKKQTLLLLSGTLVIMLGYERFCSILLNATDFLGEEYDMSTFMSSGVGILRAVAYLVVPIYSFIVRNQINREKNAFYNACINFTIVSCCFMLISTVGGANFLGRMAAYLDVFTCISIPVVFSVCKNNKFGKSLFVAMFLVYYYTYYYKYHIGYCYGDWFGDIYSHASILTLFG